MKIDFSAWFYFAQLFILFSALPIIFFGHFHQKWLLILNLTSIETDPERVSLAEWTLGSEGAGVSKMNMGEQGGGGRAQNLESLQHTFWMSPNGDSFSQGTGILKKSPM